MTGPRKFLFVDLCNDPGSDRVVAEMGRLGAHCELIGPPSSFAAKSRFVQRIYPLAERGGAALRGLQLGRRLERFVAAARPDIMVPLDDLAARALRDGRLYRSAGPELKALLEKSLGAPECFDVVCSRQRLFALAARLGARAPRTEVIPDLATARRAAEALGYPVVLKREQTAGGAGVAICRDVGELTRAYRRGHAVAWAKRRLAAIPGFGASEAAPLILQEYIAGQLAFRVSACADGVELEGADFVAERRDPFETGSSAYVRGVAHPEMRETTRMLIAALRCSGFVSLDFIVAKSGEAYLLELNARPIGCGHLGRLFGHDILSALLRRCADARPPGPVPQVIALFPKALDRGAFQTEPDLWHDEPSDDPEVVEAYRTWLARRHPKRRRVALGTPRALGASAR